MLRRAVSLETVLISIGHIFVIDCINYHYEKMEETRMAGENSEHGISPVTAGFCMAVQIS